MNGSLNGIISTLKRPHTFRSPTLLNDSTIQLALLVLDLFTIFWSMRELPLDGLPDEKNRFRSFSSWFTCVALLSK